MSTISKFKRKKMIKDTAKKIALAALTVLILSIFLMPLMFGITTSLKDDKQMDKLNAPVLPSTEKTISHKGKDVMVYNVPLSNYSFEIASFTSKELVPVKGKNKLIAANVGGSYHFRIFDANGKPAKNSEGNSLFSESDLKLDENELKRTVNRLNFLLFRDKKSELRQDRTDIIKIITRAAGFSIDSPVIKEMALVRKGRQKSIYMDLDTNEMLHVEGSWRALSPVWVKKFRFENYPEAWKVSRFLLLLRNTFMYALIGTFGMVLSSSMAAYGFARFRIPKKGALFMVVMATIILPPAVTTIPLYTIFYRIGWVGTWLPLIVPMFFTNGYTIFLLRQFFMGIPRTMDEAAMIDGAGPIRTFFSIILPQALPALMAAGLFHFFFCWNDFFGPMIYLGSNEDLYPITIGLTYFNNLFGTRQNLVQAASMLSIVIPLTLFFFAQRFFMQGVVVTGVDK